MKTFHRTWLGTVIAFLIALVIITLSIGEPTQAQFANSGAQFTLNQVSPAVNTLATQSKGAVAGTKHVIDCVIAKLVANTTAPAAAQVNVIIRDGATGAGTIIWQQPMALQAVAGLDPGPQAWCPWGGLAVMGSTNTAITVEFSAAGGANTFEGIWARGHEEVQ